MFRIGTATVTTADNARQGAAGPDGTEDSIQFKVGNQVQEAQVLVRACRVLPPTDWYLQHGATNKVLLLAPLGVGSAFVFFAPRTTSDTCVHFWGTTVVPTLTASHRPRYGASSAGGHKSSAAQGSCYQLVRENHTAQ